MSNAYARATEALYIVIVRDKTAEQQLKQWAKNHPRAQASVESNRMKLYDPYSLSLFQVYWNGNWSAVTIWDCWNKRHIHMD
jgi:hypothetical protein